MGTPKHVIIGAGGHAKVVVDLLKSLSLEILAAYDAHANISDIYGVPVRPLEDEIFKFSNQEILLVNAIGSVTTNPMRKEIYDRFTSRGYRFATLIHPSATVSPFAKLGAGTQIHAGSVVQAGAQIGENVILNTRSSVDHETQVGSHSHIAPGCVISANAQIGTECHIGVGSVIIQSVVVGDQSLVGAGAVVTRSIAARSRVIGVPARPIAQK